MSSTLDRVLASASRHRAPRGNIRRCQVIRSLLFVAALGAPTIAAAGTLDRVVTLRVEQETTLPLSSPARPHVVDPEIVTAEIVGPNEVRLTARSTGTSLVFLHGDLGLSAWRVNVDSRAGMEIAREEAIRDAEAACDSLERTADDLEVFIASADCHAAVARLGTHVLSTELSVRFNEAGLRAQLAAQEELLAEKHPRLAPVLQLAYLGVTLRIRGKVAGPRERDAVLRTLWSATAGRMLVDLPHLEVGPGEAQDGDGGAVENEGEAR